MSSEKPIDVDRAAIEEAAQREAERAALRKVRKQLDTMEQGVVKERKILRTVLVLGVIVVLVLAVVVWQMISRNRDLRGPPVEIPRTIEKK
ncbi:MAG: hypothetical protein HYX46_05485 [Betaproteobacteria bacterium]|nr:hypothetical protein [Betaproteobacteria bacterium]